MFSNLNLYYLNQMGITPWIEKSNHEPLTVETKKDLPLLIVTSKLSTKEQQLLANICLFLALPKDKIVHFETDDLQKKKDVCAAFTLLFGFNSVSTPRETRTESLDYFLLNPSAKKKLLQDLLLLKSQLVVQ